MKAPKITTGPVENMGRFGKEFDIFLDGIHFLTAYAPWCDDYYSTSGEDYPAFDSFPWLGEAWQWERTCSPSKAATVRSIAKEVARRRPLTR